MLENIRKDEEALISMLSHSVSLQREKERGLVETGACCSAVLKKKTLFLWVTGLVYHTPLHLQAHLLNQLFIIVIFLLYPLLSRATNLLIFLLFYKSTF